MFWIVPLAAVFSCFFWTGAWAEEGDLKFVEEFKEGAGQNWHVANYDFSHPHFDTDWRKAQVLFGNGTNLEGSSLVLSPKTGAANNFDGGSMRRNVKTSFGRYEVTMQAARGDGVVSGFFTYSGPYYGTQHDEIDIEFLGKDTTKIHVAWFVDGVLTNHFVDLGFDAADRPRDYAFEWSPESILWFSEGRIIFEHHASDGPVPQTPGYLFANIWAADPALDAWSGIPKPNWSAEAKVLRISFEPKPAHDLQLLSQ